MGKSLLLNIASCMRNKMQGQEKLLSLRAKMNLSAKINKGMYYSLLAKIE
jgi:hypothetical protein